MGENAKPLVLTVNSWQQNNEALLRRSEDAREEWLQRQAEAGRVIRERWQVTFANQSSATGDLAERARLVFRWQAEVKATLQSLNGETTRLQQGCLPRLAKALIIQSQVRDLCAECLQLRDSRRLADSVEDNVQKSLKEEERTVSLSQKLLEQCIEDCQLQIKRNGVVREKLENDWSNKCDAYQIDSRCTIMNTGDIQNLHSFGTKQETNRWSSPDSWIRHTMELMDLSRREMEASRSLRSAVDQTIRTEAAQIRSKAEAVDRSLAVRIREYEEILFLLRNNSKEMVQEILKAEKLIGDLRDILLALKSGPLVLTKTRLTQRNFRPNNELCFDNAQNRLQTELVELGSSQRSLEEELRKTEQSLTNMQDTLSRVQEEARLKQESLDIDRTRCCPVRQQYPALQKLLGY